MREREGLVARIRHLRRIAADDPPAVPSPARGEQAGLRALETRVAHLEALVEGLQDSVYRESERHSKLIAELEARIQPAALNAALSEDARIRGL